MRAVARALALCCALTACERGGARDEDDAPPAAKAAEEAESSTVSLSPEAARELTIAAAERAEAPALVHASGRVLDSAALVEVSGALASAEVAASGAAHELERMRALARDDGNASQREVAAAALADAEARGALAAARARALASFGTSDGAQIARLGAALARGELAVGRIELAPGIPVPRDKDEIRVTAPALGGEPQRARLLGIATATDPSVQARPVLVALAPAPPPSGAALEATFALGAPVVGVWVPESAVVWTDGVAQAFVASGPATFTRRSLAIARPLRDGYLASSGVAAGERVVVQGAQQLLSSQRVTSEPEQD